MTVSKAAGEGSNPSARACNIQGNLGSVFWELHSGQHVCSRPGPVFRGWARLCVRARGRWLTRLLWEQKTPGSIPGCPTVADSRDDEAASLCGAILISSMSATPRAHSSIGRAPLWQGGGSGFESPRVHVGLLVGRQSVSCRLQGTPSTVLRRGSGRPSFSGHGPRFPWRGRRQSRRGGSIPLL